MREEKREGAKPVKEMRLFIETRFSKLIKK